MNAPLSRRSLIQAGLVSLPIAGGAVSALSAPAADPFASYHAQILALHDAINRGGAEPEMDRLMDRWGEIDELARASRPTTLAGALGAVEYARRELHQFRVEGMEENGVPLDRTDVLVLHLLDGAIGILRQFAAGGAA